MFYPASVEIVTQANTAANMGRMPAFQAADGAVGMPDRTFTDRMTLFSGDVLTVGVAAGAPRARAGQTVTITIDGVGRLETPLVAEAFT
jgi:2-keto-4-pentenoate hydratase